MKIKIISSYGWNEALLGLSLSYNQPIEKMPSVAKKLIANSTLSSGELKFLEYVSVYLDITAPLYFWNHFDTYRIGNKEIWRDGVKQSESKMHTILKNELTQENFESPVYDCTLKELNNSIKEKKFIEVINNLPDGFLQRRIYKTDIKTLMYICSQRDKHKLEVWKKFTNAIKEFLEKEFKENLDGIKVDYVKEAVTFSKQEMESLKRHFNCGEFLDYPKNGFNNMKEINQFLEKLQ